MGFKKGCCKPCPDTASLILRLVIGSTFIMHGSQKVLGAFGGHGLEGVAQFLTQLGFPMPTLMAYLLGYTEFLGGIALVLGLGTRIFALLLSFAMVVAIFSVHWKNGFFGSQGGFEYPFVILGGTLALAAMGCQKWGLDCWIKSKCCKTEGDTSSQGGACCSR
ncbi:MAG: DoxX family protein [Deltaproteobacteria bacterium]|nr:DoxX family protein [Deltaproteobacteria bacterium]